MIQSTKVKRPAHRRAHRQAERPLARKPHPVSASFDLNEWARNERGQS